MKKLLTEQEAADLLSVSIHKMQRDRRRGSEIPFRRIGSSIRYALSDLEAYLQKHTYHSTSEYKHPGGR